MNIAVPRPLVPSVALTSGQGQCRVICGLTIIRVYNLIMTDFYLVSEGFLIRHSTPAAARPEVPGAAQSSGVIGVALRAELWLGSVMFQFGVVISVPSCRLSSACESSAGGFRFLLTQRLFSHESSDHTAQHTSLNAHFSVPHRGARLHLPHTESAECGRWSDARK